MAKVIWTEAALAQFEAILDFIALDKPEAARAIAARTITALDHLERFVQLGRPIPEFPHEGYHQVWIKPCWLYCRCSGNVVTVLHVRRAEKPLSLEYLLDEDN
jgi:toxin ParE1/3/4